MNNNPSLLCGVHVIYETQMFFEDSNRSTQDILNKFPYVKQQGISLNEISEYLREKKYSVVVKKITEKSILDGPMDVGYIVLLEGKGQPHFVFKRKKTGNEILIIDFPSIIEKTISLEHKHNESNIALQIAKGGNVPFFIDNVFIFGILFFILLAFGFRIIFQKGKR